MNSMSPKRVIEKNVSNRLMMGTKMPSRNSTYSIINNNN